jgi:hypothetical protein
MIIDNMKQENIISNIENLIRKTGRLAFAIDIKGDRQVLNTAFFAVTSW